MFWHAFFMITLFLVAVVGFVLSVAAWFTTWESEDGWEALGGVVISLIFSLITISAASGFWVLVAS